MGNFRKVLSYVFLTVLALAIFIPGHAAQATAFVTPDFGHMAGMALIGLSTNKIVLRSVEEFMSDYVPIYQPMYPLFLGKSQAYSEQTGKLEFRRVQTVGDIRAKHITPKDTEMRQIAVME